LSFDKDRESRRRRKQRAGGVPPPPPAKPPARNRNRPPASDVGDALRSAYQRTLSEDIPPEMLDLLGKLG